jgi:dTDP-4-amino-4,6-dideoxygalactose transaminase
MTMAAQVVRPRSPVLAPEAWLGHRAAGCPAVDELPHLAWHSSGRAALKRAVSLAMARNGRNRTVLVPSYHCPTMAAAVVAAGARPRFYAIGARGEPLLDCLADEQANTAAALIVPHYFGFGRALGVERQWCDARGVTLIEDCAHTFFGHAGGRPVGAWGDYAIASLTKFFPVDEAGLLASGTQPLDREPRLARGPDSWRTATRLLLASARAGRLPVLGSMLRALERWREQTARAPVAQKPARAAEAPVADEAAMLAGCDMGRVDRQPSRLAQFICRSVARHRIVERRRRNWERLAAGLGDLPGCRVLLLGSAPEAPYVLALWADEPDTLYHRLRAAGAPVFRWDTRWPGVPTLDGDNGSAWSHHVIQFLCHQSLTPADIEQVVREARAHA